MTDTLLYWKAPDGTRTRDLLITNQSLYQLSHGSALNRTILWYQRWRVLSREKWKFTCYVTKALRCNGFVAGPNSAGSFYVLFYYTLLWKTCSKCPAREIHSPSGFAAILDYPWTVNIWRGLYIIFAIHGLKNRKWEIIIRSCESKLILLVN